MPNLCEAYEHIDRHEAAIQTCGRAIAIFQKHPELQKNVDYAISLGNLGYLYLNSGEFSRAQPLLLKAIKQWEISPQPGRAVNAMNNLAALYQAEGRLSMAAETLRRAIACAQQNGASAELIATLTANLGWVYIADRRWELAEAQAKALSGSHPELAASLLTAEDGSKRQKRK